MPVAEKFSIAALFFLCSPNPSIAQRNLSLADAVIAAKVINFYAKCVVAMVAIMLSLALAHADQNKSPDGQALELNVVLAQAAAGSANDQNILGAMYQTGSGVARNEEEAARWYAKAADQGHAAAQANLGAIYMSTRGPLKDSRKGVELLKLSAAQQFPLGIARLGAAYLQGSGIAQDTAKGTRLLLEAVDLGVGLAAYELGRAYFHGSGATKDAQKAEQWFRKSAELGYSNGQYVYARHFETDSNKRFDLYQRAADGGHAGAQFEVGRIYGDKTSQTYNLDEAIYWYSLAALNGNEMGNQARFKLGLPDVNGNEPLNTQIPSSSRSTRKLDGHETVATFAVAAGIAILLMTLSSDAEGAGSDTSERKEWCEPCIYGEREVYGNQCQNMDTGALRSRICR